MSIFPQMGMVKQEIEVIVGKSFLCVLASHL
jgi:hypothetical protein